MKFSRIRELREQRGRICDDARHLIPETGQRVTADNQRKFDLMMAEADRLNDEIGRLERAEELESLDAELRRIVRPPLAQPTMQVSALDEALDNSRDRRYQRAFSNYLRNGLFADNYGFKGFRMKIGPP